MSFRVGIIGLPVVDQVAHIPTFPERGGHVAGTSLTLTPGGPAVNYASAIARLGDKSFLIGPVGDDVFGRLIIDALGKEGVDVSYLQENPASNTVTVLVLFDEDGQGEMRSFSLGMGELLKTAIFKDEKALAKLATLDALFLDGILVFSDTWVLDGVQAAENLKKQSKPPLIVCDPNLRVPGNRLPLEIARRVEALFKVSDLILVNEQESFLITGTKETHKAIQIFLDNYPNLETVVLKRGAAGALIQSRAAACFKEPILIPPFSVQVVDTSGAGDSFGASFILALLEGRSLEEAGYLAAAAGALATVSKGAWLGLPTRSKRDELAKKAGVLQ